MNRKLRLLVTTDCPNKCPMCCNNQFDFSKLPVVDRWSYDEVMITGGEPMLYERKLLNLVRSIRDISEIECGNIPKVYVYTSLCRSRVLNLIIPEFSSSRVDGIVLTPHKPENIEEFLFTNEILLTNPKLSKGVSLRLNLFSDMKALLPEDVNLSAWQVKDMEWKKDCPVPEGEDFRRIANLW